MVRGDTDTVYAACATRPTSSACSGLAQAGGKWSEFAVQMLTKTVRGSAGSCPAGDQSTVAAYRLEILDRADGSTGPQIAVSDGRREKRNAVARVDQPQ